jgi:phage tail tape-measure protein
MSECPKCKSKELHISQSFVEGAVGIGAQVGGVVGGLVLMALGPLGMLVGLLAGGGLGGWGGHNAGNAFDPRWKYICLKCGHAWKVEN